ncbi:MAG TPA: hypothetical protein VGB63_10400 [Pedobacter sp.]|jgi:hypothetical protein
MNRHILILFIILSSTAVKAQSTYGVQVGADYDTPVGSWAHTYKPVVAYHADFLWFADENTKTINFTVGYNTFKPKADTLYFLTKEGEDYGYIVNSDYETYTAYVGWMRNFSLTETFKVGLGFNFGAYFSHYTTSGTAGSSDMGDINAYLAAKTGVLFDLSNRLQLNVQAKYNGFTPTGKNDPTMPVFNDSRLGTVNYTWAAGLALAYKF